MPDAVADEDVTAMVRACCPDWEVREFERSEFGTDFVCFVACETPGGEREAVLKATTAGFVDPQVAQAEPRLFDLLGRETTVPVPEVFGYVDEHDEYPAPFYLMERLDGENFEGRPDALPAAARERVVREAGENLAELHELGTLPRVGSVGVVDGDLAVLDGDHGPVDDLREWVRAGVDGTLDALADGTYFPDLADEPDRFADLVPALREELDARLDALSEPDAPRYCHWDYRYGNLLVDPGTGETRAVLDLANLTAAEPAYNLAKVESHLFDPQADGEQRAVALRETFRRAYARERDDWAFTPAIEERMETYSLTARLDAMACLPLWLQDATPAEKDEREAQHRAFVESYL
ncbi:phosphotransferase family protein [Halorarius litoreus]|uniref:phosphotransferase family protein n=1 Tax=Halorarius litoreus TaxID=2962676 RepID=UPI0020CE49E4|nr:phosphotransferase [Halorarius litoreus]